MEKIFRPPPPPRTPLPRRRGRGLELNCRPPLCPRPPHMHGWQQGKACMQRKTSPAKLSPKNRLPFPPLHRLASAYSAFRPAHATSLCTRVCTVVGVSAWAALEPLTCGVCLHHRIPEDKGANRVGPRHLTAHLPHLGGHLVDPFNAARPPFRNGIPPPPPRPCANPPPPYPPSSSSEGPPEVLGGSIAVSAGGWN